MSKFGAHISIGKRDGFGQALKACADAGSPVPVVFALDQNVMPDIEANSPATILIYRTQEGGNPNPPYLWQGDPIAAAERWFQYRIAKWLLNPADYYAATNETDPATLAQFDWLNAFEYRLMELADSRGIKLAIGAHSAGTPSDDGGITRYERWARLVPSLQYAKSHGHILLLHEYGMTTTLDKSYPDLALRYDSVLNYLALYNADPFVVISECSDFNGYSGEGAKWLNGLRWYDLQTINDKRVIGFCAYQLGGDENWYKLIGQWRDWVIAHPTPKPQPEMVTVSVTIHRQYLAELKRWVEIRGGTVTE